MTLSAGEKERNDSPTDSFRLRCRCLLAGPLMGEKVVSLVGAVGEGDVKVYFSEGETLLLSALLQSESRQRRCAR